MSTPYQISVGHAGRSANMHRAASRGNFVTWQILRIVWPNRGHLVGGVPRQCKLVVYHIIAVIAPLPDQSPGQTGP